MSHIFPCRLVWVQCHVSALANFSSFSIRSLRSSSTLKKHPIAFGLPSSHNFAWHWGHVSGKVRLSLLLWVTKIKDLSNVNHKPFLEKRYRIHKQQQSWTLDTCHQNIFSFLSMSEVANFCPLWFLGNNDRIELQVQMCNWKHKKFLFSDNACIKWILSRTTRRHYQKIHNEKYAYFLLNMTSPISIKTHPLNLSILFFPFIIISNFWLMSFCSTFSSSSTVCLSFSFSSSCGIR